MNAPAVAMISMAVDSSHDPIATATEVIMEKVNSCRREEPQCVMTFNGESVEHHLGQVPDERLDQFLRFIARLLVRDLRDYPELPGDSGTTD